MNNGLSEAAQPAGGPQSGAGRRGAWFARCSMPLMLLVAAASSAGAMDIYEQGQITRFSAEPTHSGTIAVTIRPEQDALYSCPGARIRETDRAVNLLLVRCRTGARCPVDVQSKPDPAAPGNVVINIPDTGKNVVLTYPSGSVTVWP